MDYLIDPQGRWWRWPSAILSERLGYPDPDFDLAAYMARSLGYVWLIIDEDLTLLQFRAGMLSDAAINSLKPYLHKEIATRPVGLIYYAGDWREEAYIAAEPLLMRLEELAAFREPRVHDQFIANTLEPREWLNDANKPLSDLFELWRFEGGVYSDSVQRFLQKSGLVSRTVVVSGTEESNLRVMQGGSGFSIYESFSMENMTGRRIVDQPDREYGKWVSQSYLLCRHSGLPQIDDVDAIIQQPGHDSRRRRYQRLILRWRQPGGDIILTGSSLLTMGNPRISERTLA